MIVLFAACEQETYDVADLQILSATSLQLDAQIRAATLAAAATAGAMAQGAGASLRVSGAVGLTASGDITIASADNLFGGAVRAAQWLIGKGAGRYSMSEVLGL